MTARSRSLLLRLAAVAVLFAGLAAVRVHEAIALLPNPLTVDLVLGQGELPRSEPLIVAGESNRGDFLTVRFVDPHTVTFVYDSWGHAGIVSQPVTFEPGARLRLIIEMPALNRLNLDTASSTDRVRISAGGVAVLDTIAHYFPRDPGKIYFAENPLGGAACGPLLRGRIFTENGRELRGTPALGFPVKTRLLKLRSLLVGWAQAQPRQVLSLLFVCLATVFLPHKLIEGRLTPGAVARGAVRHRWFLGAAGLATLGFTWLVTLGTFRFNEREVFGNFYDYQAASLLEGRLDVPWEAIGGEAFEARGKVYGYFGPTPALLRLPFVASGLAFGKLSRACMLTYFVASLLAAYLILREGLCFQRRGPATTADDANDVPAPFAVCVLTASAGWGSTIFFLGSRGLIFHEAILGGIALALWSGWCSLRFVRAPASRWWIGALVCGILSIHTRPPTGLFALTLLGCVGVALALRQYRAQAAVAGRWSIFPKSLRRYAGIGALCAGGALSLNGLAYLKFGVFEAAPLRMSKPYENPERLAHIDGKSFHAVNLPFNFYTYVIRPNFRLERGFPWIYLGSPIPGYYFPKAKIDLPDHTLALPYAMPSLFGLATLGCLGAMFTAPGLRPAVVTVWLAALPMTIALFAAVATAQRYTGDFCPLLITAAALALAALEPARPPWRLWFQAIIIATTLAGIAVTVALTLHYQGETLWGVPEEARLNYQHLRQTIDHVFGLPPP